MRRTHVAGGAFAALLIVAGCDQPAQPKTFDDCILTYMGGVTSDNAAMLIRESCRAKFPGTKTDDNEIELTDAELSNLTGRFDVFRNYYGGKLYNGNSGTTVTSITIKVTESLGGNVTSREYRQEVEIAPLSVKDFGVNILIGDEGTEYSWDITLANGYRK